MKKLLTLFSLSIVQMFAFIGCASSTGPIESTGEKKVWTPVAEFTNICIKDIKIINDELYISGRTEDRKGVLYKSSDGEKWSSAMPSDSTFMSGLNAIDSYRGKIIGVGNCTPICIIEKDTIIPISPIVKIYASQMTTTEKGIFIGTSELYDCAYFSNDSLTYVQNHLYTNNNDNECIYEGGGIKPIAISKLLKERNSPNERILISNTENYNFVTAFSNGIIDCFPHKGLSPDDKGVGSYDMIYIGDTLYACTMGRVVYYDNSRGWKMFGDSLPKIHNIYPTALAITYDELRRNMYVGTTYSGVLRWKVGKGWESFNEGITPIWGDVYTTVTDIMYFKGNLFLTYGDRKKWQSQWRGVLKIKL
ncbi:MAG: hypothetical protein Q8903_10525 [Bacteroidota bacterium]|nr:hypothetical protein [Bacteroidota bacterium]